MDNRKLIFNYPQFTNNKNRFDESVNYKSPESLLVKNKIYFEKNNIKQKSLEKYFCFVNTTIEYKNYFANAFTKNFLYNILRPQWNIFLANKESIKINILNDLVLKFKNTTTNSTNTDSNTNSFVNYTIETNNYSYKLVVKIKTPSKSNIHTDTTVFLKNNRFHLLTLFVLLSFKIQPLLMSKYEYEGRNMIEDIIFNHFDDYIKSSLIPVVFDTSDKINLLTCKNSGVDKGPLSVYETSIAIFPKLSSVLENYLNLKNENDINDFMRIIFFENYSPNGKLSGKNQEFLIKLQDSVFYYEKYIGNEQINKEMTNNDFIKKMIDYNDSIFKYNYDSDGYIGFADIDQSFNSLKLSDLLFSQFLYGNKKKNFREKFIGSVIFGFSYIVGVDLTLGLVQNYGFKFKNLLKANTNNTNQNKINVYIAGDFINQNIEKSEDIEAAAETIAYKFLYKLLPLLSVDKDIQKEIVKNSYNLLCGCTQNNNHPDSMIRSNYIRYFPEFDELLPQENKYYNKYLKYKQKYLSLKI
jgi:hypothetical protein